MSCMGYACKDLEKTKKIAKNKVALVNCEMPLFYDTSKHSESGNGIWILLDCNHRKGVKE